MLKLDSTYPNIIYFFLVHYWYLLAYICKSKVYLFTHIEYSHGVLKVSLSMPIENSNYYYQTVEYQLFHIGLFYRSSIINLYKMCAYVTILKAKHSSMKYVYINGYVIQTILSLCESMLTFETNTMNYIYIYCFLWLVCHLHFSNAFNVCNFVLLGLYISRCSPHITLLYIKQDVHIKRGMVVLFMSKPHYNIHQFSSLIKQTFHAPEQHISINLVKIFCSMLDTLSKIHLLILPIDDLLNSLLYDLLNNINFIFLYFINFVNYLYLMLYSYIVIQAHKMFIVQSDVTLIKFLYLCRNQSKCSTLHFSKARMCCYRYDNMSDSRYIAACSAVILFICKDMHCCRGAENQYYFYWLTYYPVR